MSRALCGLRLCLRAALAAGSKQCQPGIAEQALSSQRRQGATAAFSALSVLQHSLQEGTYQGASTATLSCQRPWSALPRPLSASLAERLQARCWSSAAVPQLASDSEADDIALTDAAAERLKELLAESTAGEAYLRLTVEAGGCSGFSYKFDLERSVEPTDRVFEHRGVKLVTDDISLEFVKGATVDYVQELIKSTFEVVHNPNASGGCGCGSSFNPK